MIDNERSFQLVVACEAGGAEIVSSIAAAQPSNLMCCLDGPAKDIFRRKMGEVRQVTLDAIADLDPRQDTVLTSTSYISDLERSAIARCRQAGVYCISFIDHWVNYRLRFGSENNWKEMLPDEVWVSDEYGYEIALRDGFPEDRLRITPNPHIEEVKRRIEEKSINFTTRDERAPLRLLFLSEPVSQDAEYKHGKRDAFGFTEFDIAESLVTFASERDLELAIRTHPIEDKDKYKSLVCRIKSGALTFSTESDFLDAIINADVVIAVESMGLVWAAMAGKKAISLVPSDLYSCHLPHREIVKIRSITELADHV